MNTGKLALFACAVLLILALHGCGGGIDIDPEPPAPPPPANDLVWDQGNWDEVDWT